MRTAPDLRNEAAPEASIPGSWTRWPLLYFWITAATGVLLRAMVFLPSWSGGYARLLHAHSHTALLGWAYTALILLLAARFLPPGEVGSRFFRVNWGLTQAAVLGMFAAFAVQGYGPYSIALSTVHILLSYSLGVWMWRRLKTGRRRGVSVRFAQAALACMALSSAGPWALAWLGSHGLQASAGYRAALYFYLHFQYNGWLTLGLFAVLYAYLEERRVPFSRPLARIHLLLYTGMLPPAFLLSMLWAGLPPFWHGTAALAGLLQAAGAAAFILLWRGIPGIGSYLFQGWAARLLRLSLLVWAAKMGLEAASSLPALEALVFESRSVIVGYLHLVLLGFVSLLLLACWLQQGWLEGRGASIAAGVLLLAAGLGLNELLLFLNGWLGWLGSHLIPWSDGLLPAASLLMLIGISLLLGAGCKRKAAAVPLRSSVPNSVPGESG
ncbi:hypothetical protein J2T17_006182 [Paenibacillus mucilaginosus]|uniref:hypothetical protein n=1 Tax=Paenibacillus mucilaginosus TaxID=61624 RepID=UPI003D1B6C50